MAGEHLPDMKGWAAVAVASGIDGYEQYPFDTQQEMEAFVHGLIVGVKRGSALMKVEMWIQPDPPPPSLLRIVRDDLKPKVSGGED